MTTVVETHRTALQALFAAVPNAGAVHKVEPFATNEAAFRTLYVYTAPGIATQVRGWYLRRTATRERVLSVGRAINAYTWQLRGFMAMNSAALSEVDFDVLIEGLRKAYRTDTTLGGAAAMGPVEDSGIQLVASGPVLFAGVLCHAATLQFTTFAYLDAGE